MSTSCPPAALPVAELPAARTRPVLTAPAAPAARRRAPARGAVELLLLVALWGAYSLARLAAPDDVGEADATAQRLLAWERAVGLDVEAAANAWLGARPALEVAAAGVYASAHYVVTAAVLALLWWRRPEHYRRARRALLGATLVALACYVAVPTTPPRLLPGYTDSLAATADVGWWGSAASAPAGMGELTNQYAALPSMHVGWALWCALAVAPLLRRRWQRTVALGYPLLVTAVVVATANHWVLDAVGGVVLVLAAWALAGRRPGRAAAAVRAGAGGAPLRGRARSAGA
ncbi:phosphatase PAP2 family protein [Vallicoccus soli]|uniref:phosphatase PAP2 family protein n=1 Tax=Vallicoccus soli TaxID=2339232 RepID=UPI001403630A|nr:phosphatase PAP2 family protein [Vallicoccus soli]